MRQPSLDGMPARLYRATPTRLATWLDCPRRYRFTYLDRPAPAKGPPWAHNTVGAVAHAVLAQWWRLPRPARTVARADRLVDEYWTDDGFQDREQATRWRQRVREMVCRLVAGFDPDDEPRGVERTVAVVHRKTALTGRVDRVDQRGDHLVVVDYKTGRRPPSTDDARSSLALAVYAAAVARTLRGRCRRVELHHVPTGEVLAWEYDDAALARHLDRADSLAQECATADAAHAQGDAHDAAFPPRPSPLCGWCDYAQHCPEGRAVAGRHPAWAGLGE